MKRMLPIIIAAVILVVSLYFIVFKDLGEKQEVRVEYTPGEFFTTNVHGKPRHLKTAISLIVNKEGMEDYLQKENTRIRDTIIFILRDLTEEEILELGTQERLRERILNALNERLGIDIFVEVLFNDFVMV